MLTGSKQALLVVGGLEGLRLGARRAMRRPRMRSKPLTKSALPMGLPVCSAALSAANPVSSARSAHGGDQMALVQGNGSETIIEEMSAPAAPSI
jgi:hypothetical protein